MNSKDEEDNYSRFFECSLFQKDPENIFINIFSEFGKVEKLKQVKENQRNDFQKGIVYFSELKSLFAAEKFFSQEKFKKIIKFCDDEINYEISEAIMNDSQKILKDSNEKIIKIIENSLRFEYSDLINDIENLKFNDLDKKEKFNIWAKLFEKKSKLLSEIDESRKNSIKEKNNFFESLHDFNEASKYFKWTNKVDKIYENEILEKIDPGWVQKLKSISDEAKGLKTLIEKSRLIYKFTFIDGIKVCPTLVKKEILAFFSEDSKLENEIIDHWLAPMKRDSLGIKYLLNDEKIYNVAYFKLNDNFVWIKDNLEIKDFDIINYLVKKIDINIKMIELIQKLEPESKETNLDKNISSLVIELKDLQLVKDLCKDFIIKDCLLFNKLFYFLILEYELQIWEEEEFIK